MPKMLHDSTSTASLSPLKSLEGNLIRLEALSWEHFSELTPVVREPRIWEFTSSEAGTDDALSKYLAAAIDERAAGTSFPFVVRWRETGGLIGFTRLKSYSKRDRRASVGSWFIPVAWGSGANAEAKLLLLDLAFGPLGCIRVEFYTDSNNVRSQTALNSIGAMKEGVLRSHSLNHFGVRRDSVLYSMLLDEWPASRSRLVERLEAASHRKAEHGGLPRINE